MPDVSAFTLSPMHTDELRDVAAGRRTELLERRQAREAGLATDPVAQISSDAYMLGTTRRALARTDGELFGHRALYEARARELAARIIGRGL